MTPTQLFRARSPDNFKKYLALGSNQYRPRLISRQKRILIEQQYFTHRLYQDALQRGRVMKKYGSKNYIEGKGISIEGKNQNESPDKLISFFSEEPKSQPPKSRENLKNLLQIEVKMDSQKEDEEKLKTPQRANQSPILIQAANQQASKDKSEEEKEKNYQERKSDEEKDVNIQASFKSSSSDHESAGVSDIEQHMQITGTKFKVNNHFVQQEIKGNAPTGHGSRVKLSNQLSQLKVKSILRNEQNAYKIQRRVQFERETVLQGNSIFSDRSTKNAKGYQELSFNNDNLIFKLKQPAESQNLNQTISKDMSKTVLSKFRASEASPRGQVDSIFGNRKVNKLASRKLRQIIRLQSQRKTLKSALSKEEEAKILEQEFRNIENMMLTLKPPPSKELEVPNPPKKKLTDSKEEQKATEDSMCLQGKKYEYYQRQKLKTESISRK